MIRKRSAKKASLVIAAVMTATAVLSACSSDKNGGESSATGSSEASSARGSLKVEVFDRGSPPKGYTASDNNQTAWIKEQFGKAQNIDVEFVPIPRSEEVTKLNVLMASGGDVPDIVFTYDSQTFYRYAEQGGLTELTDLLNQYGPNLKKFLGEDLLTYGQLKGEQFAIPGKRTLTAKYISIIRQDWLDKLGMKAPTTTDELYATLKAFKEKDPGNTGGKVVPMGMTINSSSIDNLLWSFVQPLTEEQRYTLTQKLGMDDYPTLLPGFKDGVQFLNKLYNEGLISKDFALDKDSTVLNQDIQNGFVGVYNLDYDGSWYNDAAADKLSVNVPEAVLEPIDPFTDPQGKHPKPVYNANAMYIMIPKTSKNAVEAIKYLDWLASDNVLFTLQNGTEGENYTLENGIPVAIPNATEEAHAKIFNNTDLAIIVNGKYVGDDSKNAEAFALGMPTQYQGQFRKSLQMSSTDPIEPVNFDHPLESEAKYGTSLQDKYQQLVVKATMAKPSSFDATFEEMLKLYMSSGGQAILDEHIQAYKDMQSK